MRKRKYFFAFPGFIVAVVIFSFLLDAINPLRAGMFAVFAPPYVGVEWSRAWLLKQLPFVSSTKAGEKIKELEQQNTLLRIKQMQNKIALENYNELILELAMASSTPDVIPVPVISRNVDGFSDSILLGSGSAEGIMQGSFAISEGVFIGFVQRVSAKTSVLQLAFSPLTEINGTLASSGIQVLLEGKGAGLYITKIPRGTDIKVGDIIVHNLSDQLILGEVVVIEDEAPNPFLELLVRSPVNISTLTHVLIKK